MVHILAGFEGRGHLLGYRNRQGKRMKVCDPMAGALSGRSQVRKPCRTRQRAGPQRRLLTYFGHKEASCVSPEDDPAVLHSIQLMLRSENCTVHTTDLGEEGVELAKLHAYDIIFLDLNLPDLSGYEVLQSLRTAKVNTPILILSGLVATANKVKGLGFGADDYVTKPFHKDELLARVQAVVRRSQEPAEAVVRCGDLAVNVDAKRAEIPVSLSR